MEYEEKRLKGLEILAAKRALVFSGAGIKGISEIGALSRLQEMIGTLEFTHLIGTSIGSIVAATLSCLASLEYMKNKMNKTDMTTFKDNSNCQLKNVINFWKKYGWYDGKAIEEWMGSILKELTNNSKITFKQLYNLNGVHLTIVYVKISGKSKGNVFYADHLTSPDLAIKRAVRRSTAIPLYYKPDSENINNTRCLHNDGGLLNNYAMNVPLEQGVDPDKILGFRFCPSDRKDLQYNCQNDLHDDVIDDPITNPIDYALTLIDILWEQAARVHVHEDDWLRTVKIHTGDISSTKFDLTEEEKDFLYKEGRLAIDNYLEELISRM